MLCLFYSYVCTECEKNKDASWKTAYIVRVMLDDEPIAQPMIFRFLDAAMKWKHDLESSSHFKADVVRVLSRSRFVYDDSEIAAYRYELTEDETLVTLPPTLSPKRNVYDCPFEYVLIAEVYP